MAENPPSSSSAAAVPLDPQPLDGSSSPADSEELAPTAASLSDTAAAADAQPAVVHTCSAACVAYVHGHASSVWHAFATALTEHRTMKHCAKCLYVSRIRFVGERPVSGVWRGTQRTIAVYACERCGREGVPCVGCVEGMPKAAKRGKYTRTSKGDGRLCFFCTSGSKAAVGFKAERILRAIKQLVAPLMSAAVLRATPPPEPTPALESRQEGEQQQPDAVQVQPYRMSAQHATAFNKLFRDLVERTATVADVAHLLLRFMLLLPASLLEPKWNTDVSGVGMRACLRRLVQAYVREGDDSMPFPAAVDDLLFALRQIAGRGLKHSPAKPQQWSTVWMSGTLAVPDVVRIPQPEAGSAPHTMQAMRGVWMAELAAVDAAVEQLRPRAGDLSSVEVRCAPMVLQREVTAAVADPQPMGPDAVSKLEPSAASTERAIGQHKKYGIMSAVDFANDAGDVLDVGTGLKDMTLAVGTGGAMSVMSTGTATSSFLVRSYAVADASLAVHDNIGLSVVFTAADGIAKVTGSVAVASGLGVLGLIYVGISPTVTAMKGIDWLVPKDKAGSVTRVAAYAGATVGSVGSGTALAAAAATAGEATMLASAVEGLAVIGASAGGSFAAGLSMVAAVPAALALATAGSVYGGVKLGQHIARTYSPSVASFRRVRDDAIAAVLEEDTMRIMRAIARNAAELGCVPDPLRPAPKEVAADAPNVCWSTIATCMSTGADGAAQLLPPARRLCNVMLCSVCELASCFSALEQPTSKSRGIFQCGRCSGQVTPCRMCDMGMAKNPQEWCSLCWAPRDEARGLHAARDISELIGLWHRINDELEEQEVAKPSVLRTATTHASKLLRRSWELVHATAAPVFGSRATAAAAATPEDAQPLVTATPPREPTATD